MKTRFKIIFTPIIRFSDYPVSGLSGLRITLFADDLVFVLYGLRITLFADYPICDFPCLLIIRFPN